VQLLLIPIVLTLVGFGFSWYQQSQQAYQASQAEAQRLDDARESTMNAYIDRLSSYLLDSKNPLDRTSPEDARRTVERIRTLDVLSRLDPGRKVQVLQFLYEANLIANGRPIILLHHADLSGTNLRLAPLRWANLSDTDLTMAHLHGADLTGADLTMAHLRGADLTGAHLFGADLSKADLSDADLAGAHLRSAHLTRADLTGAHLSGADLRDAHLSGVTGLTDAQLEQQTSNLNGAILPSGKKHG
jgi:uncharacterized protein YjbI with pentapeptide repeats